MAEQTTVAPQNTGTTGFLGLLDRFIEYKKVEHSGIATPQPSGTPPTGTVTPAATGQQMSGALLIGAAVLILILSRKRGIL